MSRSPQCHGQDGDTPLEGSCEQTPTNDVIKALREDDDLERCASALSAADMLAVTLRLADQPDVELTSAPDDDVLQTVAIALGFKPERVMLGKHLVEGGSFASNCIEDDVRLTVVEKVKDMQDGATWHKLARTTLNHSVITVDGVNYNRKACYKMAVELEQRPDEPWWWHSFGYLGGGTVGVTDGGGKTQLQEFDKKACYEQALALDPEYAYSWHYIGHVGGITMGGIEYNHKACYERAVELDPEDAYNWSFLGVPRTSINPEGGGTVNGVEYTRMACYERALDLDPAFVVGWHNLGYNGGGTVKGIQYSKKECYERTLELDPDYQMVWKSLGEEGGGTVGGVEYSQQACADAAEYLKVKQCAKS